MLEHKGITLSVTSGWWERLSSRRNLMLRTAVPLTYVRVMATDKDTLNDLLEETLKANDLLDKPACKYNCDETGSPMSLKVVSDRACSSSILRGVKDWVQHYMAQILFCISQMISPMRRKLGIKVVPNILNRPRPLSLSRDLPYWCRQPS